MIEYINKHNLWNCDINFNLFLSERAEQRVFIKNLSQVKQFLGNNGFDNTKNNSFDNTKNNGYYNDELGIILEDLNDENVLAQNDVLYFIDTVFYLKSEKW